MVEPAQLTFLDLEEIPLLLSGRGVEQSGSSLGSICRVLSFSSQ